MMRSESRNSVVLATAAILCAVLLAIFGHRAHAQSLNPGLYAQPMVGCSIYPTSVSFPTCTNQATGACSIGWYQPAADGGYLQADAGLQPWDGTINICEGTAYGWQPIQDTSHTTPVQADGGFPSVAKETVGFPSSLLNGMVGFNSFLVGNNDAGETSVVMWDGDPTHRYGAVGRVYDIGATETALFNISRIWGEVPVANTDKPVAGDGGSNIAKQWGISDIAQADFEITNFRVSADGGSQDSNVLFGFNFAPTFPDDPSGLFKMQNGNGRDGLAIISSTGSNQYRANGLLLNYLYGMACPAPGSAVSYAGNGSATACTMSWYIDTNGTWNSLGVDAGTVVANTALEVGGTAAANTMSKYITGTVSVTGASVSAGACNNQGSAITETGAAAGDACFVGLSATPGNGLTYGCFTSSNACQIYACNASAGALTSLTQTERCTVIH